MSMCGTKYGQYRNNLDCLERDIGMKIFKKKRRRIKKFGDSRKQHN